MDENELVSTIYAKEKMLKVISKQRKYFQRLEDEYKAEIEVMHLDLAELRIKK